TPALAIHDGEPILLVGEDDKIFARKPAANLDDETTRLELSPLPDEITAIAAIDMDQLLAVRRLGRTITICRNSQSTPERIIHPGGAVRRLAVSGDEPIVAATDENIVCLHLG